MKPKGRWVAINEDTMIAEEDEAINEHYSLNRHSAIQISQSLCLEIDNRESSINHHRCLSISKSPIFRSPEWPLTKSLSRESLPAAESLNREGLFLLSLSFSRVAAQGLL
ncbi:hypothetical protein R6Q59_025195 [Mikania micrantha]